jgi:ketosteroid isomerase-like protein
MKFVQPFLDTAEQEISKRYAETVVLANNNDFEAFASVYTEDGILMAVGVEPSHGRAGQLLEKYLVCVSNPRFRIYQD